METTFCKELKTVEDELTKNGIMVLATSANDKVTVRSMCTLYHEGKIYFQTNSELEKYKQIEANCNVALTQGYIQIEGVAKPIGKWDEHPDLLSKYCINHKNSYETYKNLPTEEVIEVSITKLKNWRYVQKVPYMIELDLLKESLKTSKQI